jgi:hypothetical protein
MTIEITPGVAVGSLKFGAGPEEVENSLGRPEGVGKTVDDEIEWEYPTAGLTVYFEGADPRLASVMIDSPSVTLFGERIIGMPKGRFIAIARRHGAAVEVSEDEEATFLIAADLGLFASVEDGIVTSIVCEAADSAA